jgi:hypothetical protein
MRLWTLHPRYLDAKGLVALWREGLLARKVLAGRTRGYRHHPQLLRFTATATPLTTIDAYLHAVADEADARAYRFDRAKLGALGPAPAPIAATTGQIAHEREHLRAKLSARAPTLVAALDEAEVPQLHPLFARIDGPIADWERP